MSRFQVKRLYDTPKQSRELRRVTERAARLLRDGHSPGTSLHQARIPRVCRCGVPIERGMFYYASRPVTKDRLRPRVGLCLACWEKGIP